MFIDIDDKMCLNLNRDVTLRNSYQKDTSLFKKT